MHCDSWSHLADSIDNSKMIFFNLDVFNSVFYAKQAGEILTFPNQIRNVEFGIWLSIKKTLCLDSVVTVSLSFHLPMDQQK